ncbi:MAG: hypothetical protein PHO29_08230 [Acetobacterium sp.]|nr:hypothetical protein [Acetobacterium sp.]
MGERKKKIFCFLMLAIICISNLPIEVLAASESNENSVIDALTTKNENVVELANVNSTNISDDIYSDHQIYMADAIINGFRDEGGINHPLEGMKYRSLYGYAISDKPLYKEAAEYLINDGVTLAATSVWAGLFDHTNIIKNQEYYYEIVLMDYLKFETNSEGYQSALKKKALSFGEKTGNEIFDYMVKYNLDPQNFQKLSKTEAGKIMANTNVAKTYGGLYDECFSVATSAAELLNLVSDAAACAQAREERIAALELMKENASDNRNLQVAIQTVLKAVNDTDLYIAGKTIEQITNLSLDAVWDLMTTNNPIIKGYELTGLGFDVLFGSSNKQQTNLKLLTLYIIDSKEYLALIEAKHRFDEAPTLENAVAFNGVYQSYMDFKLYGLDFIKQFAENTVSDSLLGYLTKFFSGSQLQVVDDFVENANDQIAKISEFQSILDNYQKVYLKIYRASDSVYDEVGQDNTKIAYCTHVQNIGWQDFVSDGELSGTQGKGLRLEGIKIRSNIENVGVEYKTHVQNIGWQEFVTDGELSGTEGLSYRLEAIKIDLIGSDVGLYDIYYRVHTQNIGWMGWAKNGEASGSEGFGYRLEGIEICIISKGGPPPGSTERPFEKNIDQKDIEFIEMRINEDFINSFGEIPSDFIDVEEFDLDWAVTKSVIDGSSRKKNAPLPINTEEIVFNTSTDEVARYAKWLINPAINIPKTNPLYEKYTNTVAPVGRIGWDSNEKLFRFFSLGDTERRKFSYILLEDAVQFEGIIYAQVNELHFERGWNENSMRENDRVFCNGEFVGIGIVSKSNQKNRYNYEFSLDESKLTYWTYVLMERSDGDGYYLISKSMNDE